MQNHEVSLNALDLIWNAGWVVKFVMFGLFTSSVGCWAIIFFKRQTLTQAEKQNELFLQGFWGGWNISEAFTRCSDYPLSPAAKSFQSAIRELRKFSETDTDKALKSDIIIRTLRKSNSQEVAQLESSLSWLATTASAAPFVGLFGTVWGIMNSFQNIGMTGSANLAAVAPGISEALIATAIGLFAAIPAVVAYNRYSHDIDRLAIRFESFIEEFSNILQRQSR